MIMKLKLKTRLLEQAALQPRTMPDAPEVFLYLYPLD